jgi:hypothetical protein
MQLRLPLQLHQALIFGARYPNLVLVENHTLGDLLTKSVRLVIALI